MIIEDQMGREIEILNKAFNVVSLVPSITELLVYWKQKYRLRGVTSFCPNPFGKVYSIGGTKNPNLLDIMDIEPDLIIANKEENRKEDIELIAKHFPTYISNINKLEDVYVMMKDLGKIFKQEERAQSLFKEISESMRKFEFGHGWKRKALYFVWRKPMMIAGGNTFIDDMIERAGFKNIGREVGDRYPEITKDRIAELQPDVILLSSEPYRFNKVHRDELKDLIPLENIVFVDAKYFSWYGSRLRGSAAYFTELYENQFN